MRDKHFSFFQHQLIGMFYCRLKAFTLKLLFIVEGCLFFQAEHHLKLLHNNANDFSVILQISICCCSFLFTWKVFHGYNKLEQFGRSYLDLHIHCLNIIPQSVSRFLSGCGGEGMDPPTPATPHFQLHKRGFRCSGFKTMQLTNVFALPEDTCCTS